LWEQIDREEIFFFCPTTFRDEGRCFVRACFRGTFQMAPGTEEARWKRKVDRLIYIVLDLTVWKEVMTWLNLWPKLGLRFRYVEILGV
jgi:hypothetical protein